MSELSEHVLEGLRDELKKLAGPMPARIHAMLGSAGALGGVGAAGGALLGAGIKGVRGYRDAREQGAGRGQALGAGLGGAAGGAAKGALIGGATGLVGGGAAGYLKPSLGNKMRAAVDAVPGAHFGQRQVHALTDWKPEKGLGSIGHGAAPKLPAVEAAKKELELARAGKEGPRIVDRVLGRSAAQGAEKRLVGAQEAHAAAQKAEEMGLTSIPGYLESLHKHGPGKTFRAAFADQWKGMSPVMKGLTVGVPALELAGAVKSKNEVDEQGHTKSERVGRSLASTAGGLLLSPLPMVTQMAVGSGLSRVGQRAGRLVGRPALPGPEQDTGQAVPLQREISERAAGTNTEGLGA